MQRQKQQKVIIDLGSNSIKIGFASESLPRKIINYSREADFSWKSVCTELRKRFVILDEKSAYLIISERVNITREVKEGFLAALFEEFKFQNVALLPSSYLVVAAHGKSSGLVLDIGQNQINVVPVFENTPLFYAHQSIHVGVNSIFQQLANSFELSTTTDRELLERIYLACTSNIDCREYLDTNIKPTDFGQTWCLNRWFDEHNYESSIPNMLAMCLLKCPIDVRSELIRNVMVVGGGGLIPNIKQIIQVETRAFVAKSMRFQTICKLLERWEYCNSPFDPSLMAWIGGSLIGGMKNFKTPLTEKREVMQGNIPDWAFQRNIV